MGKIRNKIVSLAKARMICPNLSDASRFKLARLSQNRIKKIVSSRAVEPALTTELPRADSLAAAIAQLSYQFCLTGEMAEAGDFVGVTDGPIIVGGVR